MVCCEMSRDVFTVSPLAPGTLLWAGGRESWAGGGGQHREPGDVTLLIFPAVGSDRGGFDHQVSVWRRLSLHFSSCPLYRQFPSYSRQDENLCWWSLPPCPPVWGHGLQRLRPRGGTSQVGQECRSLILLLESLLPQPGLHSQSWDSWIPSISEAYGENKIMCIHGSLIPFSPKSQNVHLLIS